MIIIKMPGGGIQHVDPTRLLWMRMAFDWEVAGTVMLRLGNDVIYSIESLAQLEAKFAGAKVRLAHFTAPEGNISPIVNAAAVVQVEKANPNQHHDNARAVLKFSLTLGLAVRESVAEAEAKLASANAVA
jgi:hypothetical protein